MNAIRLNITTILAVLSVMPSLAQSSDSTPLLTATPYTDTQSIPSVTYGSPAANSALLGSALDQPPKPDSTVKARWDAARIRTNALSMEISRPEMITSNDRASLAIYAPMQAVNVALSFAGYVSQSRLDDSSITWIQVLSLAAKQQIHAELKYSVKISSYSKFDSFVTYKLNSDIDSSKAGMAAGLRYNIKF